MAPLDSAPTKDELHVGANPQLGLVESGVGPPHFETLRAVGRPRSHEVAELALGEEVNLDLVNDDTGVVDGSRDFETPEFFDCDGFALPRDETALGAGSLGWRSL